jgi:hypothetical protein
MTRDNRLKANLLLKTAPRGAVLSVRWLKAQGISTKLAWWYVRSGWLDHLSDGAYKLAGDHVGWEGALYALQQQYQLPIHVGGKTALQLLGQAHYVTTHFSHQPLQLFSPQAVKLPRWIGAICFEEKFTLYATNLFSNLKEDNSGIVTREYNNLSIQHSSPERAALEACYLVDKAVTFEETVLLIEHLSRLRPHLVQTLLEGCRSIKIKRLFLYLAEHHQHPWVNDLKVEKLDLGKGKYTIAGGGRYNAKYQISVPNFKEG